MAKIKTIEKLKELAQKYSLTLTAGDIIGLQGELGAGKTTFTQFLAKYLGITELVTSPTYNYLKVYPIPNKNLTLVHVDAYRLKTNEDVDSIGLNDYIKDNDTIIIIEWVGNIIDALPIKTKIIDFKVSDEGRLIEGLGL